jgi:hypothetical protein
MNYFTTLSEPFSILGSLFLLFGAGVLQQPRFFVERNMVE